MPPRRTLALLAALLLIASGCDEEPRPDRSILRKTTQKIERLEPSKAESTPANPAPPPVLPEGARQASPKILAKDPITVSGSAYVSIIGRSAQLKIDHAVNLFKAENDAYPKDYDEFMEKVIRANNVALPQLPDYQKYGYDEANHRLIIIEYPH